MLGWSGRRRHHSIIRSLTSFLDSRSPEVHSNNSIPRGRATDSDEKGSLSLTATQDVLSRDSDCRARIKSDRRAVRAYRASAIIHDSKRVVSGAVARRPNDRELRTLGEPKARGVICVPHANERSDKPRRDVATKGWMRCDTQGGAIVERRGFTPASHRTAD